MKQISFSEYVALLEINPFCGYYNCFSGVPAKYNASTILAFLDGTLYCFEHDEIGGEEWHRLIIKHTEELLGGDNLEGEVLI